MMTDYQAERTKIETEIRRIENLYLTREIRYQALVDYITRLVSQAYIDGAEELEGRLLSEMRQLEATKA